MIDFSIYIWCTLSTWFIYCYASKIHECDICYIRTGYKKLLGKVLKIGLNVLTLIHPPSQCDCCVQHIPSSGSLLQSVQRFLQSANMSFLSMNFESFWLLSNDFHEGVVLDTTVTLRGGVNQCEDTFTKFCYFSQ